MSLKVLEIVSNQLLHEKMLAETNIEHILMDDKHSPTEKVGKIMDELNKIKDSSLKLSFWEEFIKNNIIIPKEEDNNSE